MRFDFHFVSSDELQGETLVFYLRMIVHNIEVASTKLALEVSDVQPQDIGQEARTTNPLAAAKVSSDTTDLYQRIFVSYSRKDAAVTKNYLLAQRALGNDVFIDTLSIPPGAAWRAALARAIDEASVFQLFWSENSASSENVKDEWDYAMKHKCPDTKCAGFIRPVFWKKPMPDPPSELKHLNFRYVPLEDE